MIAVHELMSMYKPTVKRWLETLLRARVSCGKVLNRPSLSVGWDSWWELHLLACSFEKNALCATMSSCFGMRHEVVFGSKQDIAYLAPEWLDAEICGGGGGPESEYHSKIPKLVRSP